MKKYLKLFTCLCFALLLLASFCVTQATATDPTTKMDQLDIHSWKELKQLRDASERSNSAFLSKLSALDEDCDLHTNGHVKFDLVSDDQGKKEAFASYYAQIADLKVLVPTNTDMVQVEIISMRSWDRTVSSYDINYVIDYNGETYRFYTTSAKDCSVQLGTETGDPIKQIAGDGYTVKIWERENADLNYQSYRGYFFLEGEDTPSFYATLTSSNWKEDIPKALITLYGQFRVTTADEVLSEMNSNLWIWVATTIVCVAILSTGVVLRKRRKTQAQQSE